MNTNKPVLLILFISLLLSGCGRPLFEKKKVVIDSKSASRERSLKYFLDKSDDRPTITVWIHGTRLIPKSFFPNFFYCPEGLKPVVELDRKYHHRAIAEILASRDSFRFNLEHFYLFGWSGQLSFHAREKAALELYKSLKLLVKNYKEKHKKRPEIRIIAHSHAGNVVLSMAKAKESRCDLKISELILLACPVQVATQNLIHDEMFEKIYSIFSERDLIQVLDPQGLYKNLDQALTSRNKRPFFSQRLFQNCQHLGQVKLKINGHGVMHMGFLFKKFVSLLPDILDEIDRWFVSQPIRAAKPPLSLNIVCKKKK